jgi:elongation factor Ts
MVKELREKSGAGMMECKKALVASDGDMEKAATELRKAGLAVAKKKSSRTTKEGRVEAYVHGDGKIGVLVEVGVETDFVARGEKFKEFCHDLALQVAASAPRWVRREDVPAEVIAKQREIYTDLAEGKPQTIVEKIIAGKLDKFFQETCLVEQPFVKDPDRTIEQLRTDLVNVIRENVEVRRFVRFQLGESE